MRWIRRPSRNDAMPPTKRSTPSSGSPSAADKPTPVVAVKRTPSIGEKRMMVPEADWPVPGGKDHPMFGAIYCTCVFSTMLFLYLYFSTFARLYNQVMGRS